MQEFFLKTTYEPVGVVGERGFLDLTFSLHNTPSCYIIQCHLQCLVLKFWFQVEQKQ